jgi:ParB-like nuclease family protein
MVMIQKTNDYNIFKRHPKNREIEHANYVKIMNSIKQKNLLEFRPIMVNDKMEVIDGQHRLKVASELNLPVFYQIQKEQNDEDIFLLNHNQRGWKPVDFLNYYAQSGNRNYVDLKKFMEKNNIPLSGAMAILCFGKRTNGRDGHSQRGGADDKQFNRGGFVFPTGEKYLEAIKTFEKINIFIDYICTKTPEQRRKLETSALRRSLIFFFNIHNVDFDMFMSKLELKLSLFRRCTTIREYLQVFESIYNWRNSHPVNTDDLI